MTKYGRDVKELFKNADAIIWAFMTIPYSNNKWTPKKNSIIIKYKIPLQIFNKQAHKNKTQLPVRIGHYQQVFQCSSETRVIL